MPAKIYRIKLSSDERTSLEAIRDRGFTLQGLCQFVPGHSSSQLGFAIGWNQGGLRGACMAWLGFTLPSALLMVAFVNPVWAHGIQSRIDLLIGFAAFVALFRYRVPAWLVVSSCGGIGYFFY